MCLTDISVVSGFSDVKYLSKMLEKHFDMPAQDCCLRLRTEAEQPMKGETQTFASLETGRDWLIAFWDAYSRQLC